jgi:hypothetical protein
VVIACSVSVAGAFDAGILQPARTNVSKTTQTMTKGILFVIESSPSLFLI